MKKLVVGRKFRDLFLSNAQSFQSDLKRCDTVDRVSCLFNAHAILYACFLMQLIFSIRDDLWRPLYIYIGRSRLFIVSTIYQIRNRIFVGAEPACDRSTLMNNNGSSSTRFEFRNFLHFFFSFFLVLVTLTLSGTLARLFNTRRLGQVYERKTFHASKEKKKERKKKKKKEKISWYVSKTYYYFCKRCTRSGTNNNAGNPMHGMITG